MPEGCSVPIWQTGTTSRRRSNAPFRTYRRKLRSLDFVWISIRVTKDIRSMDFYCGFCAAEKFKTLKTKITHIENKLTKPRPIQEQPFIWGTSNPVQFTQLITQIQSEEREKERRSKNLIVPENIDCKMNDVELHL